MTLKRYEKVSLSDRFIFWCIEVTFGSTRALKNICQKCGDSFFGETSISYMTVEDCFCSACIEKGEDLWVETAESNTVEFVSARDRNSFSKSRRSRRNLEKVKERDNYTCYYCGYSPMLFPGAGASLHTDHILPFSQGGTNDMDNLICSCSKCNRIAGAKIFSSLENKKDYVVKRRIKKSLPINLAEWEYFFKNPFSD